jgi:hypothetical protein
MQIRMFKVYMISSKNDNIKYTVNISYPVLINQYWPAIDMECILLSKLGTQSLCFYKKKSNFEDSINKKNPFQLGPGAVYVQFYFILAEICTQFY